MARFCSQVIVLACSNSLAIKCFAISPDKPSPSPLTSRYASSFQDMEKAVAILTQGETYGCLKQQSCPALGKPSNRRVAMATRNRCKRIEDKSRLSERLQVQFQTLALNGHSHAFAGILNHSHIVSRLKAPVFTTLEDLASEGKKLSSCVSPWFTYVSWLLLDPICSVFSCLFSSLSKRLRSKLSLCTSSWGCKLP